jgi:hypothetical protein
MGDLVLIEIFLNGDVRNGSYRSNVGQDFVALDQLSGCLSAFGGLKALSSEIKFTFLLSMPPFSFNI